MATRTLTKTGERTVTGLNPVSVPFGIISYPCNEYILIATRLVNAPNTYGYRYYKRSGYSGAYVGDPAFLTNTIGGFLRYGFCNDTFIMNSVNVAGEIYTVTTGKILDLSTFTVGAPTVTFTLNALVDIPDYVSLSNLTYPFLTPNSISAIYINPTSPNVNAVIINTASVATISCFPKSILPPSSIQSYSTIQTGVNQFSTYAQSIDSGTFAPKAQNIIVWEPSSYGGGLTYQIFDMELSDPADNAYFQANAVSFYDAPNNGVDIWIDYQGITGDNFVFRFYDNLTKYEKIFIGDLGYIYEYFRDKDGLEYGLSTSGGVVYDLQSPSIGGNVDINKWPAFLVSNPVFDIKEQ